MQTALVVRLAAREAQGRGRQLRRGQAVAADRLKDTTELAEMAREVLTISAESHFPRDCGPLSICNCSSRGTDGGHRAVEVF